jgi:hypothetical protein
MKVKVEYLVLIGIIAALAVYLSMRTTDRTLYELPIIPEVAAKDVTRIEITRKGGQISLAKKDETWLLQPRGYPADSRRIEGILSTVSSLKATALASESRDYQRYELDDERKIHVRAWSGDNLKRDFELGKAAPSFRHTFIKLKDDHRVFHARDNFRNKFDLDAADLQDKTALEVKSEAVASFIIRSGAAESEFKRMQGEDEKAPPEWQLTGGETADRAAVEKLLGAVSNLNHQGFIDGTDKQGFEKPIYTITLKDEESRTLSIFEKRPADTDKYPAISSKVEFPFFLSERQVEQIMQQPADLMPRPEAQNADNADAGNQNKN